MYPVVQVALFTIARTWKQPRCPWTDEWTKKLWYIHTMEDYLAITRNTFESVLMRWMNLEPLIQSEDQKEKGNYRALNHLCGIWENGAEGFTSRAAVEKQTWRTDTRPWEREERGDARRESHGRLHNRVQDGWPAGMCCVPQETQTGALHQPRGVGCGGSGEGGSRGRGCVYAYG